MTTTILTRTRLPAPPDTQQPYAINMADFGRAVIGPEGPGTLWGIEQVSGRAFASLRPGTYALVRYPCGLVARYPAHQVTLDA